MQLFVKGIFNACLGWVFTAFTLFWSAVPVNREKPMKYCSSRYGAFGYIQTMWWHYIQATLLTWWALHMRSMSCLWRNLATTSDPKVKETPRSFSPQPMTSLSGSAQSRSQSKPWSGTSVGLITRRICSIDCRSGERPGGKGSFNYSLERIFWIHPQLSTSSLKSTIHWLFHKPVHVINAHFTGK